MWIPQLLLTDDDAAFREAVGEGLQRRGLNVTAAADGAEAIDIFESCELHLVVLDFNMPRVNGLQVLRHVRDSGRDVPCVLLSGELDETLVDAARQQDAYEVLSKPVRLQRLCETVLAALRTRHGWAG